MAANYKIYNIHCGKCGDYVLTYHKYGGGKGILRLYFMHIISPEKWSGLSIGKYETIKEVVNLTCTSCEEVLGVPTLSKSKKWVFRMRKGFFHRKLRKK